MTGALPAGSVIGIIGGGQLGRMLAIAAARLGYRTAVLEPAEDCPAAQLCNIHVRAAYDDAAGLHELASLSDVVTYEFENVPVAPVSALMNVVPVYPAPHALEVAQDRVVEKQFLNKAGIATAEFAVVDCDDDLASGLDRFGGSGVLKTRRLGYDGKGQRVFQNAARSDINGAYEAMGSVPLILEAMVPFRREISIIAARGVDGATAAFDPAENIHRDGILRRSTVPARIDLATAEQAEKMATGLLGALDYVGILGLELFVLEDGSLLANEFAPRVHNSGHWTEAACAVSQFEQHIRAICGLPLGATERHSNCVMENLIGDDVLTVPGWLERSNTVVHLYGKHETRAGRKMGHVTVIIPRQL